MSKLLAKAKKQRRFTRTDLGILLGTSISVVDRHIAAERIEYDIHEGHRKWFSQKVVLRFLEDVHLAGPA